MLVEVGFQATKFQTQNPAGESFMSSEIKLTWLYEVNTDYLGFLLPISIIIGFTYLFSNFILHLEIIEAPKDESDAKAVGYLKDHYSACVDTGKIF